MRTGRSSLTESDPTSRTSAADPRLPKDLRMVRRLGESPLSLVFLVEGADGSQYALKVLRPSVAKDPRILERWRREGQLLEEFEHPNLVRSFGSPEVEGRPALLLEYIDGNSLRERLREGPLGWEQAARYGVQIARALQFLHRQGAIHRDVKPHNVLLGMNRGAVLADLGLVRRDEDPTMTRQGAALGSPAYMSPEQARDPSDVDEQADIYSLGATLFHALSGSPPFLGQGVGEVIHRVLHEEPEPLPVSVPPMLAKVVATAMAKDPERRYARARDFGTDLGRVLLGHPPRLLTRYRRRRQLRLLSLSGIAATLVVALLLWKPWQQMPSPVDPTVPVAVGTLDHPTQENPDSGSTATTSSTTSDVEAEPFFRAWAGPYSRRFQVALDGAQFRDALAEIDAIQRAKVPGDAPVGFLELRRQWVHDGESNVAATAERTAGQAMDLLADQMVYARDSIARGTFDGASWTESVLDLWRRAGVRVTDLPLHPGAPDPVGRLQMTQVMLENESEQARIDLALAAVHAVRQNTAQLLRAGSFDEARRRWDRLDPVVFLHSPEARADLARIEELLALDRRLQTRFRELVGKSVELSLKSGGTLQGRLLRTEDGSGYAVDYLGQTQVDVGLLHLAPGFAVPWLLGREEPWLGAQMAWCQDDLGAAIAVMVTLQAENLVVEWRPEFWAQEWQLERAAGGLVDPNINGGAEGRAENGNGEANNLPRVEDLPGAGTTGLQQELLDGLAASLPEAQVQALGRDVQVVMQQVAVQGTWNLDLRTLLRGWRLVSWRLVWHVDLQQQAPDSLTWLGDIELRRNGSAPPQMVVAGRRLSGYGILPGLGLQVLDWDGTDLHLDGIPLAPWQPSTPRLARFLAECPDGFRFASISLRFAVR